MKVKSKIALRRTTNLQIRFVVQHFTPHAIIGAQVFVEAMASRQANEQFVVRSYIGNSRIEGNGGLSRLKYFTL